MRHRLVHRMAVALPAAGVVVLLAATAPAAAAPKGGAPPGNPHPEGTTGKPVPGQGGGNPHVTPAPPPPTTPAPTTVKAPSLPAARNAPVVTATKQSTASGGGGKPCNGCAGNANGKEPPGQKNNPGDANHGHSCDGNKGIGKGNPAHEGCTSPTTTPTTTTTTATTTPEVPVVLGETLTRGGTTTPAETKVLGVTMARGSLASTGGEPVDLTVLAFGLLGVGTVLRRQGGRT
jgi:hypothetical protein